VGRPTRTQHTGRLVTGRKGPEPARRARLCPYYNKSGKGAVSGDQYGQHNLRGAKGPYFVRVWVDESRRARKVATAVPRTRGRSGCLPHRGHRGQCGRLCARSGPSEREVCV
jgi:hypothetical protein